MGEALNNDQLFAVQKLNKWWHSASSPQVISLGGGPGTGKSYTILYLIRDLGLDLDEVLFVSYMGKAVCRMIQAGLPAKTIHATCYTYDKEFVRADDGTIEFTNDGKPKTRFVQKLKDRLNKKIKLIVADEAYTIPTQNAIDLLSFGLPVIAVGDENQLEPPFGRPYFLANGADVRLTQIMRQAEGNPIIYLAQKILHHEYVRDGAYGTSQVIRKDNLTDFAMKNADVIITFTNRLRGKINDLFRHSFMNISDLSIPHVGEKVICRANDWGKSITIKGSEIYLTNGTTGFIDYIDKRSRNKNAMKIDFQPDYDNKIFRNLKIDLNRLNAPLGQLNNDWVAPDMNIFEYAYALTSYTVQGSQWDNVLILDEGSVAGIDKYYRMLYVSITRAVKSVTIAR